MCDQLAVAAIHSVIQDKVAKNECFSAWEITQAVRSQGLRDAHHEIKRVVHRAFSDGIMGTLYKKDLVSFPPGPAFVYHPDSVDAETRQPIGGTTQAPVTVDTTTAGPDDEDEDKDDDEEDDGLVTAKTIPGDTLYVSKKLVRSLGLGIGDSASIVNHGNYITIQPVPGAGKDVVVDLRGNIRVHRSRLDAAKLGTTVSVSLNNGEIVVK